MKKVSILLVGGIRDEKAAKIIQNLKSGLSQREINADVQFVNTYKTQDLSIFEDKMDMVVTAGTAAIQTKLPVIQGLCLLYPWMGMDKLYQDIEKNIK
ncbi:MULTISPECIES: hypothetical protein [Tissierellales]|jgi:hypothetical protein|uniref:Lipid-A-disaccharide synthase n=1 Tax=Acidilutibacter cellobiosedens TaxID=2507161 RepID=A0A410QC09_9FIRM|nr:MULTISPECIES: hypothetical protein [Tissierellales]MBE6083666.1 hypothetical protein [Tissierellaceae bacterium]QAT61500.1 hypothetical protein EQM13_07870 [Acidilutibacter cellobiosedens]SCL83707.1 hypothetical protein PP176A_0521 [Sporanaerobacter sp. PP17-6a]